jgi:LL-diaminopimelate aminotransferase
MPSKVPRNSNFGKLGAGYLFPVVAKKRREFAAAHPDAKVISLGIGDTTHPLPEPIVKAMADYVNGLGTKEGYEGYDPKSEAALKEGIAKVMYPGLNISAGDVFVSDGSKCDLGRLQTLFGADAKVAVQDPAYPVYVDSSVIAGRTGTQDETTKQFAGITYMPCGPENDFMPDINLAKDSDIIMFCNPNNPTGACATRAQLENIVKFAKDNGKVILYDSAYSAFISDPNCPKSIFEIPGARECAMESTSFSKLAGFTGIRLGWVIACDELKFSCGTPMKQDLGRIMSTLFNGAGSVSQAGGLAVLANMKPVEDIVKYYMENARIIRETFDGLGQKYYGGTNAPYIFVHMPGKDSWEMFDEILNKCQVVCTPGVGFGPAGQGFVRISAFGDRDNVIEACERFKKNFPK